MSFNMAEEPKVVPRLSVIQYAPSSTRAPIKQTETCLSSSSLSKKVPFSYALSDNRDPIPSEMENAYDPFQNGPQARKSIPGYSHNRQVVVPQQNLSIEPETPFNSTTPSTSFQNTHQHLKPNQCSVCDKCFKSPSRLGRHMLVHTGIKQISCDICGKKFSQRSYLTSHMLVHTRIRQFSCDVCGKDFDYRTNLTAHLLVHSGVKPFSCEVCEKKFSQKSNLTTHMLIHSGVKPFSCEVCEKKFSQKSNLTTHMLIHSGVKNFNCDVCGQDFSQKITLQNHLKTHKKNRQLQQVNIQIPTNQSNNQQQHPITEPTIEQQPPPRQYSISELDLVNGVLSNEKFEKAVQKVIFEFLFKRGFSNFYDNFGSTVEPTLNAIYGYGPVQYNMTKDQSVNDCDYREIRHKVGRMILDLFVKDVNVKRPICARYTVDEVLVEYIRAIEDGPVQMNENYHLYECFPGEPNVVHLVKVIVEPMDEQSSEMANQNNRTNEPEPISCPNNSLECITVENGITYFSLLPSNILDNQIAITNQQQFDLQTKYTLDELTQAIQDEREIGSTVLQQRIHPFVLEIVQSIRIVDPSLLSQS